jgi:serine/threonine protein phosphatase 1
VPIVERLDLSGHPGRIFVVGDMHGMVHALEDLLTTAGFDPDCDLVWSLGDLIDRGPYSHRCLELLNLPWFRAVRGNHEQLMLESNGDYGTWLQWTINGGEWSLGYPWDAEELVERLDSLPWAADLVTAAGRFGLVHADVDRAYSWPEFLEALEDERGIARYVALWSRTSANQATRGAPGRQVEGLDLLLGRWSPTTRAPHSPCWRSTRGSSSGPCRPRGTRPPPSGGIDSPSACPPCSPGCAARSPSDGGRRETRSRA